MFINCDLSGECASCTEPSLTSLWLLLDQELQWNYSAIVLWHGCCTVQSRSRNNTNKPCRLLRWFTVHLSFWLLLGQELQWNCSSGLLWYGCCTMQSRSRNNADKPCCLLQWCNLHLPLWLLLGQELKWSCSKGLLRHGQGVWLQQHWRVDTCCLPQHDRPQPAVSKCMDSTNT